MFASYHLAFLAVNSALQERIVPKEEIATFFQQCWMATAHASTRTSLSSLWQIVSKLQSSQHTAATSCNLWISVPLESLKRRFQSFLSLQGPVSAKSARSSLTRLSLAGGMPLWRISSRRASREVVYGPSIPMQCSWGVLLA